MCKGAKHGIWQKWPREMIPSLREMQKRDVGQLRTITQPVLLNKHTGRLRRSRTAVFPAKRKSKIVEKGVINPKREDTARGLWLHRPTQVLAWGKAAHSGRNSSRSLCKSEQHMPTKSSGNITAWCIGMIYRHSFWLQSIYNPYRLRQDYRSNQSRI